MGDRWLGPDDVVTFVHSPQQDTAEVNRPDAVGDLLEPERVLLERIGDEQQPLLQADGARVGDALDEEVPGILDGGHGTRVGAGRGPVERSRGPILERLVGPLVVVEAAEGVEGPLLGDEGGAGRESRPL
jgi:hypothetical protein